MTTLSTLKDLVLSSQVVTDVDINLSEYTKREEFDGNVGLSTITEINNEISVDLSPYAEKSKIGLKYDSDEKKIFI